MATKKLSMEERIALMAEHKANLEKSVIEWNDAMLDKDFDRAENAQVDIEELVKKYNGEARIKCFDECYLEEDPMLEAVKRLVYDTIAVQDVKEEDATFATKVIVGRTKPIDLLKLSKHNKEIEIGKDPRWNAMIEKLNLLLTFDVAKDLGMEKVKEINDSYAMSDIAKAFEFGQKPTSKTKLLACLQEIVNATVGDEYKAVSHDVNFLLRIYSKKSRKALHVTCANHRYMRQYIAEILHKIVLDKKYGVEYDAKK